jgi:riboflavin synthase alpha subunit
MNDRLVTEVLDSFVDGDGIELVVSATDATDGEFQIMIAKTENSTLFQGLKRGDWILLKGKMVERNFIAVNCEKIYKEKVMDVLGD